MATPPLTLGLTLRRALLFELLRLLDQCALPRGLGETKALGLPFPRLVLRLLGLEGGKAVLDGALHLKSLFAARKGLSDIAIGRRDARWRRGLLPGAIAR